MIHTELQARLDPEAPIPYTLTPKALALRSTTRPPMQGGAFGKWLARIRRERALTQSAIAAMVGCSQRAISGLEEQGRGSLSLRLQVLHVLGFGHCATCTCEVSG